MVGDKYEVYFEGWTADCLYRWCRHQVNAQTKRSVEVEMRKHIRHDHPGPWVGNTSARTGEANDG